MNVKLETLQKRADKLTFELGECIDPAKWETLSSELTQAKDEISKIETEKATQAEHEKTKAAALAAASVERDRRLFISNVKVDLEQRKSIRAELEKAVEISMGKAFRDLSTMLENGIAIKNDIERIEGAGERLNETGMVPVGASFFGVGKKEIEKTFIDYYRQVFDFIEDMKLNGQKPKFDYPEIRFLFDPAGWQNWLYTGSPKE